MSIDVLLCYGQTVAQTKLNELLKATERSADTGLSDSSSLLSTVPHPCLAPSRSESWSSGINVSCMALKTSLI